MLAIRKPTRRNSPALRRRMPAWLAVLALVAHLFQAAHFVLPHDHGCHGHLLVHSAHSSAQHGGDHVTNCVASSTSNRAATHHADLAYSTDQTPADQDSDAERPEGDQPGGGDPEGSDPEGSDPEGSDECPYQPPGLSLGTVFPAGPATTELVVTGCAQVVETAGHPLPGLQVAPKHGPPTAG